MEGADEFSGLEKFYRGADSGGLLREFPGNGITRPRSSVGGGAS